MNERIDEQEVAEAPETTDAAAEEAEALDAAEETAQEEAEGDEA